MKKYQVFISSTYEDLVGERAKTIETILSLGDIPLGMEAFTAAGRSQMSLIERAIDLSDYFVLIIGERYGSFYSDDISYTETEYNYAVANEIPILTFIKTNPRTSNEELEKQVKLRDFVIRLKSSERSVMFWENKDELAAKISLSLSNEKRDNPQVGWVKASAVKQSEPAELGIKYASAPIGFGEILPTAKNSIFISGLGMPIIGVIDYLLVSVDSKINLTLAVSDFATDDVLNSLEQFAGWTKNDCERRKETFDKNVSKIKAKRPVNNIYLDIFAPIAYVAIDYHEITESSFIQARHYLFSGDSTVFHSYFCTVRPGHFLYNYYREQILMMEQNNGKLKKTDETKFIQDGIAPQRHSYTALKKQHECKGVLKISQDAKYELFISGIHLQTWTHVFDFLVSRKDLKMRVVLINIDNAEVLKSYIDMRGLHSSYKPSLEHLWRLAKHENLEVRRIDSVIPLMFVATDMDTPDGYIKAFHLFNNLTDSERLPNIELTSANGEWYEMYKKQIEDIWQLSTPWDSWRNHLGGENIE